MLDRRRFLTLSAGASAGALLWPPRVTELAAEGFATPLGPGPGSAPEPALTPATRVWVDADRLRARLERLSEFGRPEGGTFADGVSRVAYSDADVAARQWLMNEMRAAGLTPRIDAAGNIFGRWTHPQAAAGPARPPILFGSHIDTVPQGGNFDGPLGSLAALGVIEACQAAGIQLRHPLEMVVFAHEEGAAFTRGLAGSRIVAGDVTPDDLAQTWNGMTRAEAIRKIGGNPDQIAEAILRPGDFHAYLELHIEQGGTLEAAGIPVGVVTGIVGSHRYEVILQGRANHSGTTPMDQRQDALVAASRVVLAVEEVGRGLPGRQVATVGRMEVLPNSPNAIPGQVTFTIDFRDLSEATLETMERQNRGRMDAILDASAIQWQMRRISEYAPRPQPRGCRTPSSRPPAPQGWPRSGCRAGRDTMLA
jgi:beta-ureidopropionase / N-carbamoyl-L-amino-acid hydrolase